MGLNEKQKQAVEYLEGPLLVLAGPGTGKTQLLSEKVIYILKNTDTAAENILCLTFTESGASNMRERLKSLIGREGMKVNIGTYHSFGQEILAQYKNYSPDYLRVLDSAIDEVQQFKIVRDLQAALPARDILNGDKVRDIISVISEAKSAGLNADSLAQVAKQNMQDAEVLSKAISPLLSKAVPRKFRESYDKAYLPIYEILKDYDEIPPILPGVERSIAALCRDLKVAITEAEASEKITPLSDWRKAYFEKAEKGDWRLKDRVANLKLKSIAVIMRKYQEYLEQNGLYDFDDMIIEAVRVLTSDTGFRQTLQEKYQYIMLDEFQDTNPMQFAIVKALADYEKPAIMAVGDDDQAIYEFQGATPTNLTEFQEHFAAEVVTLTENYRSTQEILDFSKQVIDQAPNRFVNEKPLTAHLPAPNGSQIHRVEFLSSDQEYTFIAEKILELIESGVKQSEIAIISNKHKYFMPLLPYLKDYPEIKIAYEKRDDLLQDRYIHELITVLRLVYDVSRGEKSSVSMLEVLSYPWLHVPAMTTLRLMGEARATHKGVFEYLLEVGVDTTDRGSAASESSVSDATSEFKNNTANESSINVGAHSTKGLAAAQDAMDFLSGLAAVAETEPLELIFSRMAEKMQVQTLKPYEMFRFYENLAALRAKLLKHCGEKPLRISDLIEMANDYEVAEMPIIATSPYRDADEAVQVLSAHKAKGLEFSYVFILSADHTCWGKGKGNNNFLALPKNLIQIRHTGTTDGEKIRVLYVALTRAKHTLFITNSLHDFNGKSPERLEYFDERIEKLPEGQEQVISPFLPKKTVNLAYSYREVHKLLGSGTNRGGNRGNEGAFGFSDNRGDQSALSLSDNRGEVRMLQNYLTPFIVATPDMRAVYLERVKNYRMSASSLTSFIDIVNAGPEEFFRRQILRAETEPETEFLAMGNLIHAVFEQITSSGISDEAAVELYLSELNKRDLPPKMKERIREKGPVELLTALKEFSPILRQGKAEVDFAYERLDIDGVPVTGKIDHIIVDEEAKTIEIYDFKTGKYHSDKWASHETLYKYMLQLGFYKLLLNNSPTYSKYTVKRAHILFVKPDNEDEVYDRVYEFNNEDEEQLIRLIQAVYQEISTLNFLDDADIFIKADKNKGIKDIRAFVEMLIEKNE